MDVLWSTHGRVRAAERGIDLDAVRTVLANPTVTRLQEDGKIRVERRVGDRWLAVVYLPTAVNQVRIVTVMAKDE